jgi:hypothetical protein
MDKHNAENYFYKSVENKDGTRSITINKTKTIDLSKVISDDYFIMSSQAQIIFNVVVKDDEILVYKPEKITHNIKKLKLILYKNYKYCKVIPSIGLDLRDYGNRVLAQIHKDKYVYIGETIYEFTTSDNICFLYYTQDENNEYAVGTIFTYLLLNKLKIKNEYCLFENPNLQYNNGKCINTMYLDEDVEKWKKIIITDNTEYFSELDEVIGIILPKQVNYKIKTTTINNIISKKEYLIHNNGGRPYKVIVNYKKKYVDVYKNITAYDELKNDVSYYKQLEWNLVCTINYINIFIGADEDKISFRGNTILLQTGEKEYTNIYSYGVRQFTITDQIIKYVSVAGNSDVIWPHAFGTEYIYDLMHMLKTPINKLFICPPYNQQMTMYFTRNSLYNLKNKDVGKMINMKVKNIIYDEG